MALVEHVLRELHCCLPVPEQGTMVPMVDNWVALDGGHVCDIHPDDRGKYGEGSAYADGQVSLLRGGPGTPRGRPESPRSPRGPHLGIEEVVYLDSLQKPGALQRQPKSPRGYPGGGIPLEVQLAQNPAMRIGAWMKVVITLGTALVVLVLLLFVRMRRIGSQTSYPVVAGQRLHALCAATVAAAWNHSARSALETDAFSVRHQLLRSQGECRAYINRMPPVTACSVLAHTALWRPESMLQADFQLMASKARILALSFLATQQQGARLWYWVPFDKDVGPMKAALRLDGFDGAERIVVRAFEGLRGELADDSATSAVDIHRIARANGGGRLPAVLDVARYLLLYRYGGLWLDADVVVMRDFAPLQGLDFAYVLQNRQFRNSEVTNNAVLGAQCPHSPFMREVLGRVVAGLPKNLHSRDVYKWGPRLLEGLPPGTFHTLPTCFFEPKDMGMGGQLFRLTGNTSKVAGILAAAGSHDGDPLAFAYHWHNRWKMRIAEDSAFSTEVKRLSELLERRLAAERAEER